MNKMINNPYILEQCKKKFARPSFNIEDVSSDFSLSPFYNQLSFLPKPEIVFPKNIDVEVRIQKDTYNVPSCFGFKWDGTDFDEILLILTGDRMYRDVQYCDWTYAYIPKAEVYYFDDIKTFVFEYADFWKQVNYIYSDWSEKILGMTLKRFWRICLGKNIVNGLSISFPEEWSDWSELGEFSIHFKEARKENEIGTDFSFNNLVIG